MDNGTQSKSRFIFDGRGFCQRPSFCGLPAMLEGNRNIGLHGTQQRNTTQANKEKDEFDKYLAASMNKLCVRDREKALEEVHGIAKTNPEYPISLEANLDELENHLISIKPGTVYEKAELMDVSYVSNRDLRLMFLRGNLYDPKAGAAQMLKFFDLKQTLFGSDKLTTDISFNDLESGDKLCLRGGSCQILPEKDRAGRTMVLLLPGLRPNVAAEHEARAQFYMLTRMLQESEETQKTGVVVVIYAIGRHSARNRGVGVSLLAKLTSSTPIPWAGIHLCCDDYSVYVFLRAVIRVLPAEVAVKFMPHFGTDMECRYVLRGYGISEGSIPLSLTGAEPLLHDHVIWYQQREVLDAERVRKQKGSSIRQDFPGPKDKLMKLVAMDESGDVPTANNSSEVSLQSVDGGSSAEAKITSTSHLDDVLVSYRSMLA
jgi:hypothetical protein